MRSARSSGTLSALFLVIFASVTYAQSDVYWRIDPNVETCSMVIDPSLTQAQWNRFTREAGAMVTIKSLASAEPLGKRHFKFAIDYSSSPVDQHDPAWINTFTHPDEDCPLGDAIRIPTVRAGMGVSDNIDIGGSWTTAPGANYGLVAGELKYAFLRPEKLPAAAVRASVSLLTGVRDFNMAIYSVDLIASKRIAAFAPYAGLRESVSIGTETTAKVDLDPARTPMTQGYAGVVASIWKVNLAAEYDVSFVNTLALAAGVSF